MCESALVAEGAAHRRGADALHTGAFVRDGGADVEVVDIDVESLFLRDVGRVLNRRTEDLFNHRRHTLVAEVNGVERLLDAKALDEIQNQLRLLGAGALELCLGAELSDFFYCVSHNLRPSKLLLRNGNSSLQKTSPFYLG